MLLVKCWKRREAVLRDNVLQDQEEDLCPQIPVPGEIYLILNVTARACAWSTDRQTDRQTDTHTPPIISNFTAASKLLLKSVFRNTTITQNITTAVHPQYLITRKC